MALATLVWTPPRKESWCRAGATNLWLPCRTISKTMRRWVPSRACQARRGRFFPGKRITGDAMRRLGRPRPAHRLLHGEADGESGYLLRGNNLLSRLLESSPAAAARWASAVPWARKVCFYSATKPVPPLLFSFGLLCSSRGSRCRRQVRNVQNHPSMRGNSRIWREGRSPCGRERTSYCVQIG